MMRRHPGLLLVLVAVLSPRLSVANEAHRVLALVIGSNHGSAVGRPDLRYADDDAARYEEIFRMVAGEGDVVLLADMDRDTAALFPRATARARPPVRAEVERAVAALASRATEARALGATVDFYLVFAGHGDVDGSGRGFLGLRDGPLTSSDIEALLGRIPAGQTHVILDSCNSFFVIQARKPGGRRFATPEDTARALTRRLPRVGVFLSSGADAEVFEWSELQAGIFSHAVRSGLAGAADANGDGRVSYRELEAFVDIAVAGVRNPAYRPRIYARGPGGDGDAALIDLTGAAAAALAIEEKAAARLTVRDADGLPWIDLHKEDGARVEVRLPRERAEGATVEELSPDGSGRITSRRAFAGPATAELAAEPAARGPGEIFRTLFVRPFGPAALAAWREEKEAAPPPVYGISRADTERMERMLREAAVTSASRKRAGGAFFLGAAAVLAGAGALAAYNAEDGGDYVGVGFLGASAVAAGGYGIYMLRRRSPGEWLHAEFERRIHDPRQDQTQAVAFADEALDVWARCERRSRRSRRWMLIGLLAAAATFQATIEIRSPDDPERRNNRSLTTFAVMAGLSSIAETFIPDPVEHVAALWRQEPAVANMPRLSLTPAPGGGMVVLGGGF